MTAATIDFGDGVVAVIIALIAFATTVFNGVLAYKTRKDVKAVVADGQPNGGSSSRDALDRIEHHAEAVAKVVSPLPPPPPPR